MQPAACPLIEQCRHPVDSTYHYKDTYKDKIWS